MNTDTQNLIAASVNRLMWMLDQGGPEKLILSELEHLATLWDVDFERVLAFVEIWNISGEIGTC